MRVALQLLTTSNFIGPWYHAALLFSGLGSIVLLFGVLFSQQIREDLVRAATSPFHAVQVLSSPHHFNPLSPNINMHVLLSVPHMFLMVLVGRICININTFHVW